MLRLSLRTRALQSIWHEYRLRRKSVKIECAKCAHPWNINRSTFRVHALDVLVWLLENATLIKRYVGFQWLCHKSVRHVICSWQRNRCSTSAVESILLGDLTRTIVYIHTYKLLADLYEQRKIFLPRSHAYEWGKQKEIVIHLYVWIDWCGCHR